MEHQAIIDVRACIAQLDEHIEKLSKDSSHVPHLCFPKYLENLLPVPDHLKGVQQPELEQPDACELCEQAAPEDAPEEIVNEIEVNREEEAEPKLKAFWSAAKPEAKWGYAVPTDDFKGTPTMVDGVPADEKVTKWKNLLIYKRFYEALLTHSVAKTDEDAVVNLASHQSDDLVKVAKHLVENWQNDEEFCQELLSGVNPMKIELVRKGKKEEQVPEDMWNLTSPDGKTVDELIEATRLFVVDYRELKDLPSHSAVNKMYFYRPVMLVYKQLLANNETQLNILGFQLNHFTKGSPVYTPGMAHQNRYKLARIFVANADAQVHEIKAHLALAHFAMEPVIISTHNCFPQSHALRGLLQPHIAETIGINDFARTSLIQKNDSMVEKIFSIGRDNSMQICYDSWKQYHFKDLSFPKELEARGFDAKGETDGLKTYYYRDDGFLLWNAIGDYVKGVVDKLYNDDKDVQADEAVQKWANETSSEFQGALNGFPLTIPTKQELCEVLQIVIWNGSGFHSAVNFPQFPYYSYVPNRPTGMYARMPAEDGSDIDASDIKAALPVANLTKFRLPYQFGLVWLLTTPTTETNLNQLAPLKGHEVASLQFQERLGEITKQLKARNDQLTAAGKAIYPFLMPENVNCSVRI